MAIQNFPAALQPIIQQGFLEREFQDALQSQIVYRRVADREDFPNKIGESLTKTRAGLKAPVTTPMNPSSNTNLDNGMTPSSWTVEQFTLNVNQYGDTMDLNIVNEGVGIASQFMQNSRVNAVQAAQSVDRIARNTLFNAYLGGNTRVRTTLGAPATTISVDDIRGFLFAPVNGQMVAVSAGNTVQVLVGSNTYTLTGVAADGTNVSTAPLGISGTLTFSGNVTVADGTALNAVVHYNAPTILRPNGRSNTSALTGTDILTMGLLLDAQAQLRNNAPLLADQDMSCYLDNKSMRQLFADPDFKLLYQGQYGSDAYRTGTVFSLLNIDFVPTTEAFLQTLGSVTVRRPILVIPGALVEADFKNTGKTFENETQIVDVHDGIAQVTRPPLDRLGQIIAQSWYYIGGFVCPTDVTANQNIIPTASNAYLKRAVVMETA
ncbi:DUF4043 domain-containing protein [Aquitalea aquatilis]|uniref:DUF4043 domain-containing protein n=1 Tax=Aquitalea aquatilis TaxID=1537400 RepID=UPI0010BDF084|nr:DUF4043 domain-containing protein [Aquitalea aquatilis]